MLSFLKRQRHALAMIPFLLATAWFFLLEEEIPVPEHYIQTPMDESIPFIKAFVIPYVLWYFYVGGMLVLLYIKEPDEFVRLSAFLGLGMFIACCIFKLFPNGQNLRPTELGGDVFGRMVATLYRSDTPTNSLPSVHVIYALGVHVAVARYRGLRGHWHPVKIASLLLSILICLSTVYIKQHSVLDVAAGVGVTFVLYVIVYGRWTERWRFAGAEGESAAL